GRGRCFAYWQEVMKCYQVADEPSQCRLHADDYIECLHQRKAIDRAKRVQSELTKQLVHAQVEGKKLGDIKAGGAVASLGLIDGDKK
ncbi:hypothetical protein BKA62DRAFT_621043, partial [Auriculariales sp. MPI-PUGE-AT-0066]